MFNKLFSNFNLNNFASNNTSFNNFFVLNSALNLPKDNNNYIIVATNHNHAIELHNLAQFLNKNNKNIYYFPSIFTTPYQKIPPHKSILAKRISILNNLITKPFNNIVITTANAFLSKIVPYNIVKDNHITLNKNNKIDINTIKNFLLNNNYQNVAIVQQPGTFAIRGDIIDICVPNITEQEALAIRLDVFDTTLEKIRIFDIQSQKTINEVDSATLYPNSEIFINKQTIDTFKNNYFSYFQSNNTNLLEQLQQNILPTNIENLLPLFYNSNNFLSNYLTNCTIVNLFGNLSNVINNYSSIYNSISNQIDTFASKNTFLAPQHIIATTEEVDNIINNNNFITANNITNNCLNFNIQFAKYKQQHLDYLTAIIEYIKDNNNQEITIFTQTTEFYQNITEQLQKQLLSYSNNLQQPDKINIIPIDFFVSADFIFNNTLVTTEYNITGITKTWVDNSYITKSNNYKKIMQQLSTIAIGDIVVHVRHGFGRYLGIKNLIVNNIEHDFLEIEYKNLEKLYLPVENIDLISLYNSNNSLDITLDKLGSNSFINKHNAVKEQIKDIAYDLVKISASRELQTALNVEINYNEYNKFAKDFAYVETKDQLNAINDIINDIINNKPIDRLVCGDVGFGKTEVAMRASFLFVNAKFQVIVIVPTTLLVEQHYNTFIKRFSHFKVNIAKLSRFTTTVEKQQILNNLQNGNINIVIGTHSLLSTNIKYHNLGLVIIDEEQSFGVIQKEQLKSLKHNINILTLTATPIPRTLQLSLKGLKDLSLITTPPVEKLPINTYVIPLDKLAIKQAIESEINNNGQVFFVCPKISDIDEINTFLENLNLNIKKISLHGQMHKDDIENNMISFKNKEFNLLVCTNIIESGLNLKNVNTIIIYNANSFGLSQLYQLRGRVGRGNIQGNAYLVYTQDNLPDKSKKRLEIMQSLDYLGASFSLASYDLDLRGAGNLLGEEQSGHIKEIGYDLYQKLLQEEINNLKNKDNSVELLNFSPTINLNIPVLLPKNYINSIELSMQFYQKIGNITNLNELDDIKNELLDRFGALPQSVINLLTTIELKIISKKLYIEKIVSSKKGVSMYFYNNTCPYVDKLLTHIAKPENNLSIKPPSILFLSINNLLNEQDNTNYNIMQVNTLKQCLNNLGKLIKS